LFKNLMFYVNMRRSLRTLLEYAEDQAEKVTNIEDIMVCFAPSTDVRCVTLIHNVTRMLSEEMWKSLVDAEIAEQAKLGMNMDTGGSCETSPSHHVVSDTCLQLDVNDIGEQEETSSTVRNLKIFLSSHEGAVLHEPQNNFDDCHHITKRTRLANDIFESGINRVDDFASDTILSENLTSEIHSSSSTSEEDIRISHELVIEDLSRQTTAMTGSSSSSSSSSSSTARRESTRCGDDELSSLPSPVLTETQIAFEDSEFASGSLPRQQAPQHQPQTYRPIQNQAPFQTIPFSTYFMSSYSDVRQRQQQEQEARIEAKVNTVACDTVILTVAPIAESEDSADIEGSNQCDGMGSDICSVAVEIDRDVLLTADEAHDEHTVDSVSQSAVCADNEDTKKEQLSSLPDSLIGFIAQSAGSKNQNRNSGYQADLQDPLHFAEWPSWIWSRVHSHPLPLSHVIAGAFLCCTLLCSKRALASSDSLFTNIPTSDEMSIYHLLLTVPALKRYSEPQSFSLSLSEDLFILLFSSSSFSSFLSSFSSLSRSSSSLSSSSSSSHSKWSPRGQDSVLGAAEYSNTRQLSLRNRSVAVKESKSPSHSGGEQHPPSYVFLPFAYTRINQSSRFQLS
jgi:hypothetical protein